MIKERPLKVEDFTYLLEKGQKVIGLVCKSPTNYSVILKPKTLPDSFFSNKPSSNKPSPEVTSSSGNNYK